MLWWNYFTYSSVGVRQRGGARVIQFQSSEGHIIQKILSGSDDVTLFIECGTEYRFGYQEVTDLEINWIGTVSNKAAVKLPAVGVPFTGMSQLPKSPL